MIPIRFNYPGITEILSGTHYMVARNGLFLYKRMSWVDAIVPVNEIKVLDPVEPSAKLLLPGLPAEILAKALKMAKRICDISESEVALLLHYNEQSGYSLSVPPQTVWPAGIDYEVVPDSIDCPCVGTIHSHGKLDAYHSATDLEDEENMDGIHITLGNVDHYPKFSLSAQIAVNGNRFPVDQSWFRGLVKNGDRYHIDCPAIESWNVPRKWLTSVKHDGNFGFGKPRKKKGGKS